jgi:hypothetical protein
VAVEIDQPTFVLTFDTELLWGIRFMGWSSEDEEAALRTRREVMPRLLSMLDDFDMRSTFAITGHLLVEYGDVDYPEVSHPPAAEWYDDVERASRDAPDGFFWPELPAMFSGCSTEHEIGLHSFSHWHFEAPETTDTIAAYEIEMNTRALKDAGLSPSTSLVFPRNNPGHTRAVSEAGVTAFRGPDPNWYGSLGGRLSRLGHVADCLLQMCPPVSRTLEHEQGMLDITGSYLLWGTEGFRNRIPQQCRLNQIRKGLRRCIEQRALFHLWMHPINLAHHPDAMLETLRRSLEAVAKCRQDDSLKVCTMGGLRGCQPGSSTDPLMQ